MANLATHHPIILDPEEKTSLFVIPCPQPVAVLFGSIRQRVFGVPEPNTSKRAKCQLIGVCRQGGLGGEGGGGGASNAALRKEAVELEIRGKRRRDGD